MNPPVSPVSSTQPSLHGSALRRSVINTSIRRAKQVLDRLHIVLPAFADWTPEDWYAAGVETQEIRDCMLGWDVTDFGSGRFHELGRTLFTLRNGRSNDRRYPKSYAEKLLIEPENQRSPIHYHRSKREDIINRGGGNVLVALYLIDSDGMPATEPLQVQVDGICRRVDAGDPVRLHPGESLTIPPGTFHQFWAETGTGIELDGVRYTVSSEVSSVCDDWNDNVFLEEWGMRFPRIEEDEERICFLCHEYPGLL